MEALRELFIKLGLSVDAASFAQGELFVHGIEKVAELAVEAVEKIGEAFIEAIEGTAHFAEQTELLSEKIGVGVEELQKLGYAATLSGSNADELRVAMSKLARAQESAKGGNEEAAKSFRTIGVSMEDLRTKSPDQLFAKMADGMKKMGPGSQRTALAMELMGRSGTAMIPLLAKGSEGMAALGEEAEELGNVMSHEDIEAGASFEQSLLAIHETVTGLQHQVGSFLIKALGPAVKHMLEWVKANRALIGQKLESFIGGLVAVGKVLASVIGFVVEHFGILMIAIGAIFAAIVVGNAAAIASMATFIASAVAAGATWLATWIVANLPLIAMAAALFLLGMAIDDFISFLNGGDSLFGRLAGKWTRFVDEWTKPNAEDNWFLAQLKQALKFITDIEGGINNLTSSLGMDSLFSHDVSPEKQAEIEAKQHERMMANMYGGGASPGATVGAQTTNSSHKESNVQVHAPITVNSHHGQSADDIAHAVDVRLQHHIRGAAPVAGH